MADGIPSSSVFTTCRFDETGRVLALSQHFNRLKEAAKQIRCLPPDIKKISSIINVSGLDASDNKILTRIILIRIHVRRDYFFALGMYSHFVDGLVFW